MLSESARMSSAVEARFRVPEPARSARVVKVVALDLLSDPLVATFTHRPWKDGITFFRASGTQALLDDLPGADLVVMIATAGTHVPAVEVIGKACSDRRIHTATLVVHSLDHTEEALSRSLAQVRPWSLMVVVVSDESYVEDLLMAFR